MGPYDRHVFVCTHGETCPKQGETENYVKIFRAGVQNAGRSSDVRINRSGCFSQCSHGPMIVHDADALEQGVHDGSVLTCLEHMWQFDVRTGAPIGDAETGLTGYRLKEERGELYVALEG